MEKSHRFSPEKRWYKFRNANRGEVLDKLAIKPI